MGLFSFARNQRAVFEWTAPDESVFVFEHPQQNPMMRAGTKVIVRDEQCAVLVVKGQVADVLGPGQHVLDPNRLPALASILGWGTDVPAAFESAIFYVQTKLFPDLSWHVSTSLASGGDKMLLQASGGYAVRVVDAGKLLAHIFEANQIYETAYLLGRLRGRFGLALAELCGEEGVSGGVSRDASGDAFGDASGDERGEVTGEESGEESGGSSGDRETDLKQLAVLLEARLQTSFAEMGLALSDVRIDELVIVEENEDAALAGQEDGGSVGDHVHFADKSVHVTEEERLLLVADDHPSKRRING